MPTPAEMLNPDIHKLRAARAWAQAYNSFDIADLEPLIDTKFSYTSMWVLGDLEGRDAYLDYLRGKLETIRNGDSSVVAEVAETRRYPMYQMPEEPYVYARQEGDEQTVEAVVLFTTNTDGSISKIVMTGIPIPVTVLRNGDIPR